MAIVTPTNALRLNMEEGFCPPCRQVTFVLVHFINRITLFIKSSVHLEKEIVSNSTYLNNNFFQQHRSCTLYNILKLVLNNTYSIVSAFFRNLRDNIRTQIIVFVSLFATKISFYIVIFLRRYDFSCTEGIVYKHMYM